MTAVDYGLRWTWTQIPVRPLLTGRLRFHHLENGEDSSANLIGRL